MTCNSYQQPKLSSSISNMFLCALEIRHNSVSKNIDPAPPASWSLGPDSPFFLSPPLYVARFKTNVVSETLRHILETPTEASCDSVGCSLGFHNDGHAGGTATDLYLSSS